MPILENQLNGRIATLLGRMAPEWNVLGENKGAFQGNQKQPDILVTQTGAQPVVIENEYLPANTVEVVARDRLIPVASFESDLPSEHKEIVYCPHRQTVKQ